jgi:Flp pilus assembly protein TadG
MTHSRLSPLASLRRDQSGSSAVEFAAVCIPLMFFLFGILEFGRAIWVEEALQNTVSKVSRCIGMKLASCASSGTYSSSLTTTYAQTTAQSWGLTIPAGNITTSASTSCPGMSGSTSYAQVTISYALTNVAANLIPALATKTVSAQACFPMAS